MSRHDPTAPMRHMLDHARIPESVRQQYPDVPWQGAASTRNFLIHGYDVVRYDILHATVSRYFSPPATRLAQSSMFQRPD